MLQFEIVQGSLKVTNGTSTILLIAKKDIAINSLSLQQAIPLAELYNVQLGYNAVVFKHPLSDCEDNLGNPFTVNSFIAFAENNFGFTTGGGGGGSVTSVGLTMPSAFNVANSPITTAGDIAVTGAGLASQYVRGDGSLASFPDIAGGGGGQVYYFNGGISEGTIGGDAFYQMSTAANLGTNADFTSGTVNNVVFANFITDVGKPTQETIPAGAWIFQCYLSASSTNTTRVYATVEVYDGVTFTVLATSTQEVLTGGTNIDLYTFTCAVPEYTPLTAADRIAVRFYPTNLAGTKTITLHTQDIHLSTVQTTFTTGIAALDGLTAAAQYLQTGTTGTDFNINQSGTDTHVFNLPTASSINRGALSAADWTTFNGKQNAFNGYGNEIHVSGVSGNDTTGNGDLLNPYATITKALSVASGGLIIVHPAVYNESPTSNVVVTIVSVNDNGSKTFINGTLTIASATRVGGIRIANLVISTSGTTYIDDCDITTSFVKSGSGFVQIDNTTLQCSLGSLITGAGIVTINGDYLFPLVVNNASANVIVKISNSCVAPSVLAGSLSIVDSILISATPTGNAITSSAGTVVTLANTQVLVPTLDNVARVSLSGFYSIFNVVYDKPNSTLAAPSGTGGSTNSIDYFQYINADKFIVQGGTSSQFLKADGTVDSTSYTPTSRTISTTSPLAGGGDLSANRTLTIAQSNTTTDGYLSAVDWTTFNGKLSVLQVTPITLTAASWTLSGGLYQYIYSNASILSTSIVDVIPANSTIAIVKAADVLPATSSAVGTVTLFATNLPTGNIIVTVNIYN
jgi:hypothetical protein